MTVAQIMAGEELAVQWRETANADNPAGPLYAAGEFAEADIVAGSAVVTMHGDPGWHAGRTA